MGFLLYATGQILLEKYLSFPDGLRFLCSNMWVSNNVFLFFSPNMGSCDLTDHRGTFCSDRCSCHTSRHGAEGWQRQRIPTARRTGPGLRASLLCPAPWPEWGKEHDDMSTVMKTSCMSSRNGIWHAGENKRSLTHRAHHQLGGFWSQYLEWS